MAYQTIRMGYQAHGHSDYRAIGLSEWAMKLMDIRTNGLSG